jgi:hypothetical protein
VLLGEQGNGVRDDCEGRQGGNFPLEAKLFNGCLLIAFAVGRMISLDCSQFDSVGAKKMHQ